MAEPISIMEDFVKDLLKENIIQTYKADRVEVRNFYNSNYRTIAKCSFHEFNWGLWQYWYVNSFTKTVIFFDQRWIDYFALDVGGNCGAKTPFNEKAYVDERKCLLCNVSFADQESYKIHLEWLHHKIRMQYVKNKGSFTTNKDITLEIAEKSPAPSKLQFPVKTDINATLCIRNTSKKDVNIMEVIMVNSLITDITVHEEFDKGVLLGPSETAKMNLHAYFEHSTTLLYPVVVVTEAKGSKQNILHLKQIEVEVTSEFSSLTPDSKYISKSPDAFSVFFDMMNAVVPGLRPDPYMSYYKETLPLRQFKIPEDIDLIFQDLVASYPEFVNRGTPTVLHYQTFRSRLNIPRGKLDVDNYFSKLDMLLHVEENQMRVDVRDYDTTAELKEIKDKKGNILYELQVPGLAEARPSLLVGDKVFIKESKQDFVKFEGIVHKVLEISVVLGLNQRFTKVFLPGKKFFIEFGFNRRPIRVEKQALFLANSHEIIPSLFPEKVEIRLLSAIPNGLQISNRQLNDEQRMSVNSIMKPKNYPFLIFGPPGTGKTVTIVESVYQLWKNYPNSKILVCAPSNAATNEVAARLIKIVPKSDMYRLLGSVYANDNDRLGEIKDIVNIKGDEFFMPSMDDLLKCRVVMTTIITAARLVNGGVPEGHYTHVFIDESGYATETQTLIPIAGILSNAATQGKLSGQIILAGDPRQLGPLVHSNFARYCGYGTSLLERLLKTCDLYSRDDEKNNYNSGCVTKLVKNYRSHETILKVPNELFYDNELIAAGNDFTDAFIGWENLKNEKFPIIFHHVEGEDARDKTSPSFFNVQEIEQVMDYLSQLIGSKASGMKINEKHIGVITPYRKQAEKLKEACSRKKWDSLLVGSVEQFQGKERLVVIISTVRSKNANKFEQIDQKCQLGFLKNPKRFNVALTRAKALLIVVGNANVLQTDNNWSSFIRYCKENKSVSGKRFTLASSR